MPKRDAAGDLRSNGGQGRGGRDEGRAKAAVGADILAAAAGQDALDRLRDVASMMACSRLAVVAVDRRGVFTYWNALAEEYYGWRASEVIGRRPRDLMASPALEVEAENVVAGMMERRQWSGKVTIHPRTGPSYEMSVTSSVVQDDDGEPIGCIFVSLPSDGRERPTRMRRALIRCAACGREVAGTTRRKYCSEKCRQWSYYHRHRGGAAGAGVADHTPGATSGATRARQKRRTT